MSINDHDQQPRNPLPNYLHPYGAIDLATVEKIEADFFNTWQARIEAPLDTIPRESSDMHLPGLIPPHAGPISAGYTSKYYKAQFRMTMASYRNTATCLETIVNYYSTIKADLQKVVSYHDQAVAAEKVAADKAAADKAAATLCIQCTYRVHHAKRELAVAKKAAAKKAAAKERAANRVARDRQLVELEAKLEQLRAEQQESQMQYDGDSDHDPAGENSPANDATNADGTLTPLTPNTLAEMEEAAKALTDADKADADKADADKAEVEAKAKAKAKADADKAEVVAETESEEEAEHKNPPPVHGQGKGPMRRPENHSTPGLNSDSVVVPQAESKEGDEGQGEDLRTSKKSNVSQHPTHKVFIAALVECKSCDELRDFGRSYMKPEPPLKKCTRAKMEKHVKGVYQNAGMSMNTGSSLGRLLQITVEESKKAEALADRERRDLKRKLDDAPDTDAKPANAKDVKNKDKPRIQRQNASACGLNGERPVDLSKGSSPRKPISL
jgi:hypothetical protein